MNRKTILTVFVAALILLAGCDHATNQNPSGEDLASDSGENISGITPGESYIFEIKITEKNQRGLVRAQPPFTMENSLERANLIRRYKYLNDKSNVHHVYLLSETGQVVHYFVAQGKVSSVNSKLTNDRQIVSSPDCINRHNNNGGDDETNCYFPVESPQMDGSYGSNGAAIFFFTTEGDYVEWNGIYLVSEEPKGITDEMILVDQPDDDEDNSSSVGPKIPLPE